jgi:hypothetical protein
LSFLCAKNIVYVQDVIVLFVIKAFVLGRLAWFGQYTPGILAGVIIVGWVDGRESFANS